MVIKLLDTIVAQVAMTAAERSKNVACLAEFELEHDWAMRQICLSEVDTSILVGLHILLRHVALYVIPTTSWDHTRFARCCRYHKDVSEGQQDPECDESALPTLLTIPVELIVV